MDARWPRPKGEAMTFARSAACFVLFAVFAIGSPAQTWKQVAELTPTSRQTSDWFGIALASSASTIAVADFDPNFESFGSVDIYVKPASGWSSATQSAMLIPSDQGLGFGSSVAINENGSIVVVGAANTSNFEPITNTPGAVYVFERPTGGWSGTLTESAKLTATDGVVGDALGNSVGISGTTIVAGAFFANNFAGRAYVFTSSSGHWSQSAELTASDGGLLSYLGESISISGNTVVAGSTGQNNFQGAVYVFVPPQSGWMNMTQTAELSAAPSLSGNNFLGQSVSIRNNTIAAGAPNAAKGNGAVAIYLKPASGWANSNSPNATLVAPDPAQGAAFGNSVALSPNGSAAAVGAPVQTVGSNLEQGEAYLYLKPAAGWKNSNHAYQEFFAADGAQADLMGTSVGIAGVNVVAGAPKSSAPGAAYIFGQ